jgi:hypothetical protein
MHPLFMQSGVALSSAHGARWLMRLARLWRSMVTSEKSRKEIQRRREARESVLHLNRP